MIDNITKSYKLIISSYYNQTSKKHQRKHEHLNSNAKFNFIHAKTSTQNKYDSSNSFCFHFQTLGSPNEMPGIADSGLTSLSTVSSGGTGTVEGRRCDDLVAVKLRFDFFWGKFC